MKKTRPHLVLMLPMTSMTIMTVMTAGCTPTIQPEALIQIEDAYHQRSGMYSWYMTPHWHYSGSSEKYDYFTHVRPVPGLMGEIFYRYHTRRISRNAGLAIPSHFERTKDQAKWVKWEQKAIEQFLKKMEESPA